MKLQCKVSIIPWPGWWILTPYSRSPYKEVHFLLSTQMIFDRRIKNIIQFVSTFSLQTLIDFPKLIFLARENVQHSESVVISPPKLERNY